MPIPNTVPLRFSQVLVQGVKHTDGITYTRCLEHMEITDESLGLAKPKAKAAKGPDASGVGCRAREAWPWS